MRYALCLLSALAFIAFAPLAGTSALGVQMIDQAATSTIVHTVKAKRSKAPSSGPACVSACIRKCDDLAFFCHANCECACKQPNLICPFPQ